MWKCPKCERIFGKAEQPHSCQKVPLEQHFKNKEKAKELFDSLFEKVNSKIGECKVISLPCCIHLFGKYDFLAILPKKDGLEVRFGLDEKLESKRLIQAVSVSNKIFKNCIDVKEVGEIDEELVRWLDKAYHLKDKT